MVGKSKLRTLAIACVLPVSSLMADDLVGADSLLCAPVQATRCSLGGDCATGPPWDWNIPQFIEIDLRKKKLSTTSSSGENRTTRIDTLKREEGVIYLQGVEGGRAFSFAIAEATGSISVAVATETGATAIFGACTPR